MKGKVIPKEKDKSKKDKKKTISQLKKFLDTLFSEYVRRKYSDSDGFVRCYTCGRYGHWKTMQNGHFVSRAYLPTRYDERNCRVQCVGCNVFGGGQIPKYAKRLEDETPGLVALLYKLSLTDGHGFPYEKYIDKYKKLLDEKQQGTIC